MNSWREFVLGPSYFYHKWLISMSFRWTRAEVVEYETIQKKKLTKGLPLITKEELRKNLPCLPIVQKILAKKVTTGGTTGTPFEFYLDYFFSRQKERAYIFNIWKDVGFKPFNLRVVVRGNLSGRLIKFNKFEKAYIVSANQLIPENKNKVLYFFRNLPPFFLHVYPSSLMGLIDFVGENQFKSLPILGVMAGSELFPKGQMDWFRNIFNLRIAHWYGHSEYAVLAKYCHTCNGFHFYPTYGLA